MAKMPDKRLLSIAKEISEAKDVHVPRLLLKLQGILETLPAGSIELQQAKQHLYEYDLHNLMLLSLKQDFTKMPAGWATAAKLSYLLSQCCIGFDAAHTTEFKDNFLPQTLEQELVVARKLQSKFIKTSDVLEDTKYSLLDNFRMVLEALSVLYSGHDFMAVKFMESPWLLQLLMSEDSRTTVTLMSSLQSLIMARKDLMESLSTKLYQQYLEEFIYKLSSTPDSNTAAAALRSILIICDSYPSTVKLLCIRYRGLRLLLSRWENKGFDRDLRRLQQLLDAGSLHQANLQNLNKAAGVIQAFWKSYAIRKKLKSADAAITNFQKSFRAKKELNRLKKEEETKRKEFEHWLLLERKRTTRELRHRQLKALEILPADQVNRHLQQEQQGAATLIQKRWRGYRVRSGLDLKRQKVQTVKAAVTLQRGVRKWLEKTREKRREPPNWQLPPGLTDDRRVELLQGITDWRETHEVETPVERREELHDKVQALLRQFCAHSRSMRKSELHQEALLARLETDADLLLNAPKLSDVAEEDISSFVCRSVPIATKATANHKEELRLLNQPWWRKLGDQYQDTKYEEELEDWKVF